MGTIDMTGWVMKEHGVPNSKLTVLEKTNKRDKNRQIIWKCQCECGNQCEVVGTYLRNGHTKSCGCLHKKNLIGQQFGYLTVIEDTNKRDKNNHKIWKCKCKCGNEVEIIETNLITNHTKSCGCYRDEKRGEIRKKDLTNQRFGKLIAIKDSGKRSIDKEIIWECKCDCGNICYVKSYNLTSGRTSSCGCLKSTGELLIKNLLIKYNISFESQKTFNNCKFKDTNALAIFDFYANNKYIIEYDGIQHFQSVEYFGGENGFNKLKEHDNFKNQYCFDNNIPIIRIPYWHLKDLCIEDLLLETSKFLINNKKGSNI